MANTYTLIASSTVGSGGAASIDFTSIPATYTDLKLVYSVRIDNNSVAANLYYLINNSTTSYSHRRILGNGSAASSDTTPSAGDEAGAGIVPCNNATANTFGSGEIYFPNYLSSNNKSASVDAVSENNGTEAYAVMSANLWQNTGTITSIKLRVTSLNLLQYSTAYLYGISNS
jgi:hypothetical protein